MQGLLGYSRKIKKSLINNNNSKAVWNNNSTKKGKKADAPYYACALMEKSKKLSHLIKRINRPNKMLMNLISL